MRIAALQSRMETRFKRTRSVDDTELLSLSRELDRLLFALLSEKPQAPVDTAIAPTLEPG